MQRGRVISKVRFLNFLWFLYFNKNNLRQCQSETYLLSSRNLSFTDEWIWGGCGDNMQYGYKWATSSSPQLRFQKEIINNWLQICSELDFKLAQILIFQICSKLHRHPRARSKGEGDRFSEIRKVSKRLVSTSVPSSGKTKFLFFFFPFFSFWFWNVSERLGSASAQWQTLLIKNINKNVNKRGQKDKRGGWLTN